MMPCATTELTNQFFVCFHLNWQIVFEFFDIIYLNIGSLTWCCFNGPLTGLTGLISTLSCVLIYVPLVSCVVVCTRGG